MRNWWYLDGKEHKGPISEAELRALLHRQEINRTSLVWREGMENWQPLSQVDELAFSLLTPPSPPIESTVPSNSESANEARLSIALVERIASEKRVTWRRFFARMLDVWIETMGLGLCLGFALAILSSAFSVWIEDQNNRLLFAILIVLPLSFVLDAAIVATFGNSIGKSLLGLRVLDLDSKTLSFSSYLKRNFRVWRFGLAAGVPVFNLFTMIWQKNFICSHGTTIYDLGKYRVEARPLTKSRGYAAGCLGLLLFPGHMLLNVIVQEEHSAIKFGSKWTNPVTLQNVNVPAGWLATSQENEQGQPIYVFTHTNKRLQVIFAKEDVVARATKATYVQAFTKALEPVIILESPGKHILVAGYDGWSTNGRMAADATKKVNVTIVQRGAQMWRLVVLKFGGMDPNIEDYRILRTHLFGSL